MSIITISEHEVSFVAGGSANKDEVEWKQLLSKREGKIALAGGIGLTAGFFLGLVIMPIRYEGNFVSRRKIGQTFFLSAIAYCASVLSIGITVLIEGRK